MSFSLPISVVSKHEQVAAVMVATSRIAAVLSFDGICRVAAMCTSI